MTIQEKLKNIRDFEMKHGDKMRLNCSRWLLGQLEQEKIQPVSDAVAEGILRKFAKVENGTSLSQEELDFIGSLLPSLLTYEEVSDILAPHREELKKIGNLGGAMGLATKKHLAGRKFNGADVKRVVENILTVA